jgi:hypothetical protein
MPVLLVDLSAEIESEAAVIALHSLVETSHGISRIWRHLNIAAATPPLAGLM